MNSFSLHFYVPKFMLQAYYDKFHQINSRGLFTFAGVFIVLAAVAIYLLALFSVFQTSFLLRRVADEKERLSQKTVVLELELQKRQADVRAQNVPELLDMEKISSIKYIGGDQATALLPNTFRGQ